MVALPGFLGVASRFLRRGSLFLFPPIRFNMPVNINHHQNKQLLKVGERVFIPEQVHSIQVQYEYLWPGFDNWKDHDPESADFQDLTQKYGEPVKRVFGAHLVLDGGELLWLDARKYWKFYGVLMQIGIEI